MAANLRHVYHLCGSPTSKFFYDLSMVYAKNVVTPPGWERTFLAVDPEGNWREGTTVESLGESYQAIEILPRLAKSSLIVPHIFCEAGMTVYRSLLQDVLGFAMVGSSGSVMSLAADKIRTREVVARSGVHIARGELAAYKKNTSLSVPLVIKPNNQDNSLGLSLVENADQLDQAVKLARQYDPCVLIEEFILGRELRLAVIEDGNELFIPSVIEYLVEPSHPIRKTEDKLLLGPDGNPQSQASNSGVKVTIPAALSEAVRNDLFSQARIAHRAIGARDFSLFDFRIDQRSGKPVFLEAGLFWSFSPESMISKMLEADGICVPDFVGKVWSRALSRKNYRTTSGC